MNVVATFYQLILSLRTTYVNSLPLLLLTLPPFPKTQGIAPSEFVGVLKPPLGLAISAGFPIATTFRPVTGVLFEAAPVETVVLDAEE